MLRYLVQPIGKVEPYRVSIISSQSNSYFPRAEVLSLSYGPEDRTDHDADGAVEELIDGLAGCSSDISLLPAAPACAIAAPGGAGEGVGS